MDAIGFGLEQYDATGLFGLMMKALIEPAGVLPGQIPSLTAWVLDVHSENTLTWDRAWTDKLLTYALGRGLGQRTLFCAVRSGPSEWRGFSALRSGR